MSKGTGIYRQQSYSVSQIMLRDVMGTVLFADSIISFEQLLAVTDFYCSSVIKWLHHQTKEDRLSFFISFNFLLNLDVGG